MPRTRPWVVDYERGERFQLSLEEDDMLGRIADGMDRILGEPTLIAGTRRLMRYWTPERHGKVKTAIFEALFDSRRGNADEWNRLKAMSGEKLTDWLRRRGENSN